MTFSCLSGADSRCLLLSQCNAQNVHTLKLAKVIFFCYYLYFWKFLAPWLISLTFPHVSCRKFSELVAIVAKRSQLLSACSPCTVCAYTIVSVACVELEKGADRSQIVVCVVGGLGSLVFLLLLHSHGQLNRYRAGNRSLTWFWRERWIEHCRENARMLLLLFWYRVCCVWGAFLHVKGQSRGRVVVRNDLESFHMKEPLKWIKVKDKGCFYRGFFQLAMTSNIMRALKWCEFLNPISQKWLGIFNCTGLLSDGFSGITWVSLSVVCAGVQRTSLWMSRMEWLLVTVNCLETLRWYFLIYPI